MDRKPSHDIGRILLIIFRILFTIFVIATTVFIFSNSLQIGSLSSLRSREVTEMLNKLLSRLELPTLTNAIVRKLAHLVEYMLLGFWFTMCMRVYTARYVRHLSWPLLLLLVVACADEFLQSFVASRTSSVRDVWIDFGGGIMGVMAAIFIIVLLNGFWRFIGLGRREKEF